MARADGLRSLMFLSAAAAVLGFMMGGRLDRRWAVAAVGVLILCDLYSVDKRCVARVVHTFGDSRRERGLHSPTR